MNIYNITNQYNQTEQYLSRSLEGAIKGFKEKHVTEIVSVVLVF
jgi:mRNA-degrading endonuclease YafQ of YafQ-DinJ toxin-antitoxin module